LTPSSLQRLPILKKPISGRYLKVCQCGRFWVSVDCLATVCLTGCGVVAESVTGGVVGSRSIASPSTSPSPSPEAGGEGGRMKAPLFCEWAFMTAAGRRASTFVDLDLPTRKPACGVVARAGVEF